MREERLTALAARATGPEQAWLRRIITGEMRTGVSDGLVLEAIGRAAGADPAAVTAGRALPRRPLAWSPLPRAPAAPRLWPQPRPGSSCRCRPMLAEPTTDWDQVLAAHGGRTGLEYKYDGARIQLHSDGDRVGVWTRAPVRRDAEPAGRGPGHAQRAARRALHPGRRGRRARSRRTSAAVPGADAALPAGARRRGARPRDAARALLLRLSGRRRPPPRR